MYLVEDDAGHLVRSHIVADLLSRWGRRRAASLGAEILRIEADPNAEGFYRRMGATRVGEISYPIYGQRRTLPLLVVEVRNRCPA